MCIISAILFLAACVLLGIAGNVGWLLLPLSLIAWASAVVVAFRQQEFGWVIGSVPVVVVPATVVILIVEACARGECL
jgi:hypothetical protein